MPKPNPDNYVIEDRGYVTPCWIWQGAKNKWGYGRSRSKKTTSRQAHVCVYVAKVGPVPDGKDLDHKCKVRPCVNPDHVEPVTKGENTRRGLLTKLDWDAIKEIRTSSQKPRELAERFGVHVMHIHRIRRNERWKEA